MVGGVVVIRAIFIASVTASSVPLVAAAGCVALDSATVRVAAVLILT
jgi:hypothetical protein